MAVTLPEITIVGNPNSVPVSIGDWFAEGFKAGWGDPDVTPEAPAPLDQEALDAFFEGVGAGSRARRNIETSISDDSGPGVEPDIGGQIFEEVDREYREAFKKFLEPHEEDEPHEIGPPEIEFAD
jgi:hypothetical protein